MVLRNITDITTEAPVSSTTCCQITCLTKIEPSLTICTKLINELTPSCMPSVSGQHLRLCNVLANWRRWQSAGKSAHCLELLGHTNRLATITLVPDTIQLLELTFVNTKITLLLIYGKSKMQRENSTKLTPHRTWIILWKKLTNIATSTWVPTPTANT